MSGNIRVPGRLPRMVALRSQTGLTANLQGFRIAAPERTGEDGGREAPYEASLPFLGRWLVKEERAMRPPEKPISRVLWVGALRQPTAYYFRARRFGR